MYFADKKHVKNIKKLIKFTKFAFNFFLSSDMNLQAYFIFYFFLSDEPTNPCLDPSTVEYSEYGLMEKAKQSLRSASCSSRSYLISEWNEHGVWKH